MDSTCRWEFLIPWPQHRFDTHSPKNPKKKCFQSPFEIAILQQKHKKTTDCSPIISNIDEKSTGIFLCKFYKHPKFKYQIWTALSLPFMSKAVLGVVVYESGPPSGSSWHGNEGPCTALTGVAALITIAAWRLCAPGIMKDRVSTNPFVVGVKIALLLALLWDWEDSTLLHCHFLSSPWGRGTHLWQQMEGKEVALFFQKTN